jgi:hypothetical protein
MHAPQVQAKDHLSPYLKLIISLLVLPLVLLHHYQSLSFVSSTRHAQLTSCGYLKSAIRPSAQFANLLTRTSSKQRGPVLPFIKSRKGISHTSLCRGVLRARSAVISFHTICSMQETKKNYYQQATYKTKLLRFHNKVPRSSFKKLIVSTPSLLKCLHMMSLSKSVPEGLKP